MAAAPSVLAEDPPTDLSGDTDLLPP